MLRNEKGEIFIVLVIIFVVILFTFLIGLLVASVTYEAKYGTKEGTIIDKEYHRAYTTTSMVYTGKVMIPQTHYHPESWKIKIEKEVDGKDMSIWVSVDESTYHDLQVGDYYKEK